MDRLWDYIVTKKMYVTGGVGVQGHGEGFARAYYLPNYNAYCETCASIGMLFSLAIALMLTPWLSNRMLAGQPSGWATAVGSARPLRGSCRTC